MIKIDDFDYNLPDSAIAQDPLPERDASRMLVVDRAGGGFTDHWFREFPDLLRGDELLVVNDTRVIPARLFAHRGRPATVGKQSPGANPVDVFPAQIEVLLVRRLDAELWEALVRPGRKV